MASAVDRPTKPKKRSGATKKAKAQLDSAKALYEEAQAALAVDDLEGARSALRQAAAVAPRDVEVVEAYGALLAELGPAEEAVAVLRRAVALSPDAGHAKYMYLGQLLEGDEAAQSLHRGIELLQAAAQTAQAIGEGGKEAAELAGQLCGALCSLAEVRLSKAAEGPAAAGEEVEALLQHARDADASSPEPMQVLASLRVEQGRPEEALAALRQSLALWFTPPPDSEAGSEHDADMDAADAAGDDTLFAAKKPGAHVDAERQRQQQQQQEQQQRQQPESGDGGGQTGPDVKQEIEEKLPSYEFRFEAAKLLLELDENTDSAIQVLEGLLAEDDAVADVWQLLAMCLCGAAEFEEALEVAAQGRTLLAKQGALPGDERVQALEELQANISQLQSAHLAAIGEGDEPDKQALPAA